MTTYLLSCSCGKDVSVEVGQAGERVACQCGAMLDVPPLRKLRHLPVAAPLSEETAKTAAAWNVRRGIVTACLILATLLAVIAVWNRLTEPTVPTFDATAAEHATEAVEEGIKTMTPAQGWRRWVEVYRPMAERGFSRFESPVVPIIQQEIAQRRFFQKTLFVVAAVFLAVALLAAFWPQGQMGRQGDKETRRSR